jgi:hypothetical protein
MTITDWKRVTGVELNDRMIYLTPLESAKANLLREKKSNTKQLVGLGIVCFAALCWLVSR